MFANGQGAVVFLCAGQSWGCWGAEGEALRAIRGCSAGPPSRCAVSPALLTHPRPRSRAGLQLGRTRRLARAGAPAAPLPPGPCRGVPGGPGNAFGLGDLVGTARESPRGSRVRLIPNFLFIITSLCSLVSSLYGFARLCQSVSCSLPCPPARVCDRDLPPEVTAAARSAPAGRVKPRARCCPAGARGTMGNTLRAVC